MQEYSIRIGCGGLCRIVETNYKIASLCIYTVSLCKLGFFSKCIDELLFS